MVDEDVPDSPLMGEMSPPRHFPSQPSAGRLCFPCCGDSDGGTRLRRKSIIGALCLFLVVVVVLAIIIFAVTRDSVGKVEPRSKVGAVGGGGGSLPGGAEQLHGDSNADPPRLISTTASTTSAPTRPSSSPSGRSSGSESTPESNLDFVPDEFESLKMSDDWEEDSEDDLEEVKKVTTAPPSTTTTTTTTTSSLLLDDELGLSREAVKLNNSPKLMTSSPSPSSTTSMIAPTTLSTRSTASTKAAQLEPSREALKSRQLNATSGVASSAFISTERSTSATSSSSRPFTVLNAQESTALIDVLEKVIMNDAMWSNGTLDIDADLRSKLKSAAMVYFLLPSQRGLEEDDDRSGESMNERFKKAVVELTDIIAEKNLMPKAESWRSVNFEAEAYEKPLYNSQPESGMKFQEESTKKVIGERVETILSLLGSPNGQVKNSTDPPNKDKLSEDYSLLSSISSLMSDSPFEAIKSGAGLGLNTSVIDLLGQMLEQRLEERRRFDFDKVMSKLSDKIDPDGLARSRQEHLSESDIQKRKIAALNRTMIELKKRPHGRLSLDDTPDNTFKMTAKCANATQKMCKDGLGCYFEDERCDRWVNCADSSDELECTCLDYLRLQPEKRCDGYPDCPRGEDEEGCHCPKGMFRCGREDETPVCISSNLRCDNVFDCDNGDDEKFCFALAQKVMDPSVFTSRESSGFLHTLVGGKWQVLSLELTDPSMLEDYVARMAFGVCSDVLPGSSQTPDFTIVNANDFTQVAHLILDSNAEPPIGLRTSFGGGRFKLSLESPHDDSTVIKINCGLPDCGVRSVTPSFPGFSQDTSQLNRAMKAVELITNSTKFGKMAVANDENEDDKWTDDFKDDLKETVEEQNETDEDDRAVQVRIVGGAPSMPQSWPFIVALLRGGKFICGSTIINDQWIITAGHCLNNFDTNKEIFQVLVGTLRRTSKSPFQYVRTIQEVYIHEKFDSDWLTNDIALAKVDKPFIFSRSVAPVCFPDSAEPPPGSFQPRKVLPMPGDQCFAVGWGNIEEYGSTSDTLMEVAVPILDKCVNSYNNITIQICAGYKEGGKDSCQGDSGGPFLCKNTRLPSKWYLGGVISHGRGCGQPEQPGVYTRVQYYLDWINNIVSKTSNKFRDMPKALANTNCSTVTCDGGKCVAAASVCNYFVDCFDSRDEQFCQYINGVRTFVPGDVRPPVVNNTYTPTMPTPNSDADIKDTRVFSVNSLTECSSDFFRCLNTHQCIHKSKVCNRRPDCADDSDERGCKCRDFLNSMDPGKICDGFPDCHDWSDEVGCSYCPSASSFFCDLSKDCISRDKVCDTKADCLYREDERYCVTLVNGDSITLKKDSRPKVPNTGIIAMNVGGLWKPICSDRWDDAANDIACRYMGRRGQVSFKFRPQRDVPLLVNGAAIRVMSDTEKFIFPRSPLDSDVNLIAGSGSTNSSKLEPRALSKRQTADSSSTCPFIEVTCTPNPACGTMPLYNFMGAETPSYGPGVFPWQVNIYKNGTYLCGASLIHNAWLLTHSKCAAMCNPKTDYCVARMGAYRDQPFMSPNEQVRRIVLFIQLPGDGNDIFIGTFDKPFVMTEFVNTLCIPSQPWTPKGTECFITGKGEHVYNHAVPTTYVNQCDVTSTNFKICTSQAKASFDCIERWSGALACPDGTGKYFAVGVYFSEAGGCSVSDPIPNKFSTLTTLTVRDNINQIVRTADEGPNPYTNLVDTDCNTTAGYLRCPLGECLHPKYLCDGVPHCIDLSDEATTLCRKAVRECQHVNATHCQCLANDFMCRNNMCVDKTRFCDGVDDCGDGTDEPKDCDTKCIVTLNAFEPETLCDGQIDCNGENDLGSDESASLCCSGFDESSKRGDFRCVTGEQSLLNTTQVSFTNQCIDSRLVCDYNSHCRNGADEENCIRVWNLSTEIARDAYGRMMTEAQGYLYFISSGRKYLYCANRNIFREEMKQEIGKALCAETHFAGLVSIKLTEINSRQRLGRLDIPLSQSEEQAFRSCLIVHLVCSLPTVAKS